MYMQVWLFDDNLKKVIAEQVKLILLDDIALQGARIYRKNANIQ